MAITYTWEITGIKTANVNDKQNAVVQTYWKKVGKDEFGNEGVFNGATPIEVNPDSKFVSFDKLKEDDVLSWIKSKVVGVYEEHVNDQIVKQIQEKTVVDANLPWKK